MPRSLVRRVKDVEAIWPAAVAAACGLLLLTLLMLLYLRIVGGWGVLNLQGCVHVANQVVQVSQQSLCEHTGHCECDHVTWLLLLRLGRRLHRRSPLLLLLLLLMRWRWLPALGPRLHLQLWMLPNA